jgi:hypothetical protein
MASSPPQSLTSVHRGSLQMGRSKIAGELAKVSCTSTTCTWSVSYRFQRGPSNQRYTLRSLPYHVSVQTKVDIEQILQNIVSIPLHIVDLCKDKPCVYISTFPYLRVPFYFCAFRTECAVIAAAEIQQTTMHIQQTACLFGIQVFSPQTCAFAVSEASNTFNSQMFPITS